MPTTQAERKARRTTRLILAALTGLVAWTVIATGTAVIRGVIEHGRTQDAAQQP